MAKRASNSATRRIAMAIALLLWPSASHAMAIALSTASIDWTGFQMVLTGPVIAADVFTSACRFVTVTGGGSTGTVPGQGCQTFYLDFPLTSGASTSTEGWATAEVLTANGWVDAFSEAGLFGTSGNHKLFSSTAQGRTDFSSGLQGPGTVLITLPYTLTVTCTADQEANTSASAFVSVRSTHNVLPLQEASDSIACLQTGMTTKSGVLVFGGDVSNEFVSSFGLQIAARTQASAEVFEVPDEAPTLTLLIVGMLVVLGAKRYTSQTRAVRR